MSVRLSAAAFVATLALAVCGPLYICPEGQLLLSTAHAESKLRTAQAQPAQKSPAVQAQSKQRDPIERARTAVETLIARLRGRDMPEGIVKSNGRIGARSRKERSPWKRGHFALQLSDEFPWLGGTHLVSVRNTAAGADSV